MYSVSSWPLTNNMAVGCDELLVKLCSQLHSQPTARHLVSSRMPFSSPFSPHCVTVSAEHSAEVILSNLNVHHKSEAAGYTVRIEHDTSVAFHKLSFFLLQQENKSPRKRHKMSPMMNFSQCLDVPPRLSVREVRQLLVIILAINGPCVLNATLTVLQNCYFRECSSMQRCGCCFSGLVKIVSGLCRPVAFF